MNFHMNRSLLRTAITIISLAVFLVGCAPSVKVRSDSDPGIDMRQFQTYNFFSQMGIESDNYSNLLGQHFRDALSSQMKSRGFQQSDAPQIQINVSAGAKDKVRVNTYQDPYLHGGYYGRGGYGYGGYYGSPWGYGGSTRTTVHQYTEANIYIDIVDSTEHKMVWQGVATFTVTDKMQEQLRETVYNTVDKVFSQFPIAAPSGSD
jgi:hypothetical protein